MSKGPSKPRKSRGTTRAARIRVARLWSPRYTLESLENRVLLSLTPSVNGTTLAFTDSGATGKSELLQLKVVTQGSSTELEYSTNGINFTDEGPLTALTAITVSLGAGNDTLRIDPSLSSLLNTDNIAVTFTGGSGTNTLTSLAGPTDSANVWSVTAPDTGTLDTKISFSGVANLIGGTGADSFALGTGMQGQNSSMTIDGGSGSDTLDYSAYSNSVSVNLSTGTATDLGSEVNIVNVKGGGGTNTFTGDRQDDTFTAGSGNNAFTAGTGTDRFIFNADVVSGTETIFGAPANSGLGVLDFSPTQTSAVTVDLSKTVAQNVTANLHLTLEPGNTVENFIGGAGTNTVTANAQDDAIRAGTGNNVFTQGTGAATFLFNADSDSGSATIQGATGAGPATLDFSSTASTPITVNLASTAAQQVTPHLSLTLAAGNNVTGVVGGQGGNTFTPNSLGDVLSGGSGTNRYLLDADNSLGTVSIQSSSTGLDVLDFSATQQSAITVDLSSQDNQAVSPNLTLVLVSPEDIAEVIGGAGTNTILGGSQDALIVAGPGNNAFTRGTGDETYQFNADDVAAGGSTNTITGRAGAGVATLDFSPTQSAAINVNLASTSAQTVATGLSITLGSGSNVNDVTGGGGSNTAVGNSFTDVFTAGPGSNTFTQGTGNATFVFDADSVSASGSTNVIHGGGGAGIGTLDFSATQTASISVNLGLTSAQTVAAGLTLTLASGNSVDNVIGGAGSNAIVANAANDRFTLGTGDNTITQGSGHDTLLFNADTANGDDVINGGASPGPAILDFSATQSTALTISLATTSQQTVAAGTSPTRTLKLTLAAGTNIGTLIGGKANDTLTAGSGTETLDGGGGDNTFILDADRSGSDTITNANEDGTDTLDFSPTGSAAVTLDLSRSTAQTIASGVTLTLPAGNVVNNFIGGAGSNTVTANSGTDKLTAGPGNNTFTQGAGQDTFAFNADHTSGSEIINGSAGDPSATLDFSATQSTALTVSLATNGAQTIASGITLTLAAGNTVENVIGGNGGNTLTGNASSNILTAGTGNDSLIGGGGSDAYVFPSNPGNDTIHGVNATTADPNPTILFTGTVTLAAGSLGGTMQITASNNKTVTFPDPSGTLTIGADTVNVSGIDSSFTGKLAFDGGTFNILSNLNLGSTDLTVSATNINLNQSLTTTGTVKLSAVSQTFAPGVILGAGIESAELSSSISITGTAAHPTVLNVGKLTINAIANNDVNPDSGINGLLVNLMSTIRPFFALADAIEQTDITIGGNTTINASGDVTITADSTAAAVSRALGLLIIAGAWGRATADATIDIQSGAHITSGGNVKIASSTNNTVAVTASNLSRPTIPLAKTDLTKISKGVDLAIALGESYATALTTLESGALISAPNGDVSLSSSTTKLMSTSASGNGSGDNYDLGLAVSLSSANANTQVAGSITAAGNVSTTATASTTDNSTAVSMIIGQTITSAIVDAVTPIGESLLAGISSAATSVKNWWSSKPSSNNPESTSSTSGNTSKSSTPSNATAASPSNGYSGALGFTMSTNDAHATVLGSATIKANGNVSVYAHVRDAMTDSAIANVTKFTPPGTTSAKATTYKKNAYAAAIVASDFNEDSQAIVANGATIDAGGSLTVNALTTVPYDFGNFWTNFSSAFTSSSGAANQLVNAETGAPSLLSNDLGLQTLFTSWAQSAANGTDTGIAFSADVYILNNNTVADIGAGAHINQDSTYRTNHQDVAVTAETDVQSLNLAGVLPTIFGAFQSPYPASGANKGGGAALLGLAFLNSTSASIDGGATVTGRNVTVNATTNLENVAIAVAGAKSAQAAGAGTADVVVAHNTTTADIGSGATVIATGDVNVVATDTIENVTISGAVIKGSVSGGGASVGVMVLERNTSAYIGAPSGSAVGSTPTTVEAGGNLNVDARAAGLDIAFALTGTFLNGTPEPAPATPAPATPGNTTPSEEADDGDGGAFDLINGPLALSTGGIDTPAGAGGGTGTADEASTPSTPVSQAAPATTTEGGAGDAAVNYVADTTLAYINVATSNNPTIIASVINVNSSNTTDLVSVVGAATGATGGVTSSLAIAVSLGANAVISTTQAFVSGGNIQANQLFVDADLGGWIGSITGGAAGASQLNGTGGAGSGSVNILLTNTEAYVTGATVALAEDSHVDATNTALIWAVAGAGAYGGRGGYGASVALNLIGFSNQAAVVPNQPSTTNAYVDNSTITMTGGTFQVAAINKNGSVDPRIIAVTGSLGQSAQPLASGIAGTISVNIIKNSTKAYVVDTSLTQVPPPAGKTSSGPVALNVTANDTSGIVAIAGAVGIGQGTSIGAALGYNETHSTIQASLDGATVNVNGGVAASAESNATIAGVAVGIAAGTGTGWAAAGSVEINSIVNTIDSHIGGSSNVTAGGNVDVSAQDRSLLVSVSGAGAGTSGGVNAFGASIAYNRVSNGINASIANSTVISTAGAVIVTAISSPLLVNVGAAGSGSNGVSALDGAATIDVNSIANTETASIDASTVHSLADIDVKAGEAAALDSIALAGSGASSGTAIGAAIAYNFIGGSFDPSDPSLISYEDATINGSDDSVNTTTVNGDNTTTTSNSSAYITDSSVVSNGQVLVFSGFMQPADLPTPGPLEGGPVSIDPTQIVTTSGGQIQFAAPHGLETGDAVLYRDGGGNDISGLTDGTIYFVIKVNDTTIKLATSLAQAMAGHPISLNGPGSGENQSFTPLDLAAQVLLSAAGASVASNQLSLPTADGFTLGEAVVYEGDDGTQIGGLTSGHTYYVIPVDGQTIKLAATAAGASAGDFLTLTDASSLTGSLTPLTSAAALAIAATTTVTVANTVTVPASSGLSTGDAVVYHNGGGTSIGGLTDAHTYYVIVVDSTHIQLAQTLADAQSDTPISLTGAGSGANQTLTPSQLSVGEIAMPTLPTSFTDQIVSVTAAGAGGSNIGGAGAIGLNFIRMNVTASISDSPASTSVLAAGNVSVLAEDTSTVDSGTGSLGVSTTGGAAVNASVGVNDIKNTVIATISGANVQSTGGSVTVHASETAQDVNVAFGGAADDSGVSFGGSFTVNEVKNTVSAAVEANPSAQASVVNANGTISVLASDSAAIGSLAGNVNASLGATGVAAIGVAFAVNVVSDTVSAFIDNSIAQAATGDIDVDASFAPPASLPAGLDVQIAAMAVSGSGAANIAGAGSVALNWITNSVTAKIENIASTLVPATGSAIQAANGTVNVEASDSSTINSLAGAIAVAGVGVESASGAVGASVAYNNLGGNPNRPSDATQNVVTASIENVTGTVTAEGINVQATRSGQINNITVGGAGAGTFALGGAVSLNAIRDQTEAFISGSTNINATGVAGATIAATDSSLIQVLAGGIGIAVASNGGTAVSFGISAATNSITDTVKAYIDSSKLVSSSGVEIDATSNPTIKALTIGGSGAVSTGGGGIGVAGAGAGSGNSITATVAAYLSNSNGGNGVTANGSDLVISATDSPTIEAASGVLSIAAASGGAGGIAVSVGISAAVNTVDDTVSATISASNATVNGGNFLTLTSLETASISALSMGGTGAGTGGGGGGVAFGGAGAGSGNTITNTVTASITGSTVAEHGDGGKINVAATDNATITADGGGVSVVAAAGGEGGAGVSVGVGAAVNSVTDSVKSFIDSSTVSAASSSIALTANETSSITALTIGGAVGGETGGGNGAGVGAAGAYSKNTITNTVEAYIQNGSSVTTTSGGNVTLTATDHATITADGGGVSLAAGLGAAGAAAGSLGVAQAIDSITDTVKAFVDNSAVTAASAVSLSANETATIDSFTLGGAVAVGAGAAGGGGVAGAGAGSTNTISNTVLAYVSSSSGTNGLTASGGSVTLSAADSASIAATSGGVALGLGAGGGPLSFGVAIGAGVATNSVTDTVKAYADGSKVSASTTVSLTASETANIKALVFGGALALAAAGTVNVSAAGAGADASNTLGNTVEAYETNAATISTTGTGAVSLTATDGATTDAEAVAGALAIAAGGAGNGSISIGAAIANNNVTDTVEAYTNGATITSGGALNIDATFSGNIKALSVAAAVSISGGSLASFAFSGAGASSTNTINNTISTDIQGTSATSKSVDTEAGAVSLDASETATIDSEVGSGALSVSVAGASIGVSQATNTVSSTLTSYVQNATLTSTSGTISVVAGTTDSVTTLSVATSVAIALGGAGAGGTASASVNPSVTAYVGQAASLSAGGDVGITATASNSAEAQTKGIAVGLVAIGASIASATASGSVIAHLDGTVTSAPDVTVAALATDTSNATSFALGGGVAAGTGSSATATTAPTVEAYAGASSSITATSTVYFNASLLPIAIASSTGIDAGLLTVGASNATATVSPTIAAYAGGASSTITAATLTVHASETPPPSALNNGQNASATAKGSSGALIGVTATQSTAENTGSVTSYVVGGTTLNVSTAVNILAAGNTNQNSDATSNYGAILALGSNDAAASSTTQTNAYLGSGARIDSGDPVGGLIDGNVYYVVVNPAHPNLISLARSFQNATNTSSATAPIGDDAQIITLSLPTFSAGLNSLTPYGVPGAAPVSFNPLTAVSAANGTINVGANSQGQPLFYPGQPVVYHKGSGPALAITANGTDTNFSNSTSGSGGVIAGSTASASTNTGGGASAYLADNPNATPSASNETTLNVSNLTITAHHTAQFDSQINAIEADVLGESGSIASNMDTSTANAYVGSAAQITAQQVSVTATNTTLKNLVPSGDYNIQAGAGGVFQGVSAESTTTISNTANATVDAGANINVVGSGNTAGVFTLYALNDVTANDSVNEDTGGAIADSGATSIIHADTNNATSEVKNGAVITTTGDVNLQTRTIGNLSVKPRIHTYGFAAAGSLDGDARLMEADAVNVDPQAHITAQGNLNLLAGGDSSGDLNHIAVTSEGYELNGSAVPISELNSEGEIDQTNTVSVATGAILKSAQDANIAAERFGDAEITAQGNGKNWLSAVASGVNSLLGGSNASEGVVIGTETNNLTTTVTINGTIQLGINNSQSLTVNSDILSNPTDFTETGGLSFIQTTESLASDLGQELLSLQQLLTEYAGDTEAENAYSAEIAQVQSQMSQLGLSQTQAGGVVTYSTSTAVPFVTVGNIAAQAGTINITGANLLGGGTLQSPGNISIAITNNSPAFLRVGNISIPQDGGGTVLFDGANITANSAIQHVNANGTLPTFSITASNTTAAPTVTIINTYDANSPAATGDFVSPDVVLAGDIGDVPTVLTVSTKGSIISEGNINVGRLVLNAGENYYQGYATGIPPDPEDPTTIWNSVSSLTSSTINSNGTVGAPPLGTSLTVSASSSGTTLQRTVANALTTPPSSSIVAGNSVFIAAQYVNIDGTIQSGEPTQSVTISGTSHTLHNPNLPGWSGTLSMTDAISGAQSAATAWAQGDQADALRVLNLDGLTTSDFLTFELPEATNDNIPVYYNTVTNQLELEKVAVQGGHMEIYGHVLSTGSGQLNVLDGYGQISVNNQTTYPLVVLGLSTGQGVAGVLKITDTARKNASGQPFVTQYTRQNGQVQVTSYYANADGTAATTPNTGQYSGPNAGVRSASYQPVAQRFVWVDGVDFSQITTTTYGSASWLKIDQLAADPGTVISSTTETKQATPLLEGEYVEVLSDTDVAHDTADYEYLFSQINSATGTTQSIQWSNSTWYGTTTNYTKVTIEQPKKDINSNSIRGDRPINIDFIGLDQGDSNQKLSITSVGALFIQGTLQNNGGATTISAPSSSIEQTNATAAIGGRTIALTASTGIGDAGTIGINATNTIGSSTITGTVNATSTSGDIDIQALLGNLVVGSITTDQSSGDVTLTSKQDLLAASSSSLIEGGKITLNAGFGNVGNLGTGGTANTPGTGSQPINVDVGEDRRDNLNVVASGNVYVKQTAGNLRLDKITTSGDVRVEVPSGDLIDADNVSVANTQNITELLALWDSMLATNDTAQTSIDATINAYQNQVDQGYRTYWQYRNEQPDPSVYDPTFEVTLSGAQTAAYTDYYTSQGQAEGLSGSALAAFVDNAITTLENDESQQYRTLNATYGKFGNTFNASFAYLANQTPLSGSPIVHQSFGPSNIDGTGKMINLPQNVFTTGEQVIYHANGGSVSGLTDGGTYYVIANPNNSAKISLATTQANATNGVAIRLGTVTGTGNYLSEVDAMSVRAAWSQSQLENSISASILQPRTFPSTTPTIPDANIQGNNVALNVSGNIGNVSGQDVISLPLSATLPQQQAIDLAAAQPTDVTFYYRDASGNLQTMQADDASHTAVQVVVNLQSGINLMAGGAVYANAGGTIALAAGEQVAQNIPAAALNIGQVIAQGGAAAGSHATGQVRIFGQAGITNATPSSGAANVESGDLFVEGGNDGGIGTATAPLDVSIAPGSVLQDARAAQSVNIDELTGDLIVNEAFSNADVNLTAAGSILSDNGPNTVPSPANWNVFADSATITAGTGSIGTATDPFVVDLQGGTLVAQAKNDINVFQVGGDLNVDIVDSQSGNVTLNASGSILDAHVATPGNPLDDVIGGNLTLTAGSLGFIGAPGQNLNIDASGWLTSTSGESTYISQTTGNLNLLTVSAFNGGTAFLEAPAGDIVNDNPNGDNILSGKTYLFASGNIGAANKPITTAVGGVQGQSTAGSTWIDNTGALVVGGVVRGNRVGFRSGGRVHIHAHSPITVSQDTIATDDIDITSTHQADDGGFIEVVPGVTIDSTTGSVNLLAGDNFLSDAGSSITAANTLTIVGDNSNPSGSGSSVTINGSVTAPSIQLSDHGSSSTFTLNNPPGINTSQATGLLTVTGGAGSNTLNVNDSSDTTGRTGTLTSSTVTGLGMGGSGLAYSAIQTLNVNLGTGNDTFSIASTNASTATTVTNFGGQDTINVGGTGADTGGAVDSIQGPLTIAGAGNDTLNVDDSGSTTAKTGTLTSSGITGLHMGSGITYSGVGSLHIALGTGNDTFSVLSTASSTSTTVANTGGVDTFNVGSSNPPGGGVLDNIQGPLTIDGAGHDTLNVDDTGSTAAKSGTLTATSLTGLQMGSSGITYNGLASLNIDLGSGGATGNTFAINVPSGQNLPATTTIDGGSSKRSSLTANFAGDFNNTLNLLEFKHAAVTIGNNFNGTLNDSSPGDIDTIAIAGSLTVTGILRASSIGTMTIGPPTTQAIPGHDLAGQVIVSGLLGTLIVDGATTGTITAGSVGTIGVYGGYGPIVAQLTVGGTQQFIEATVPSTPYPIIAPPPAARPAQSPAGVTFQYFYESKGFTNPQATIRVTNASGNTRPDQYDLSLITYSATRKFNLARLDASGVSGIRNVSVEGDVLTSISAAARAFFVLPGGSTDAAPAGVWLPGDKLAGVAVRDFLPTHAVNAASIQSLAFGSYPYVFGGIHLGSQATEWDAEQLITRTTRIVQAGSTNGQNSETYRLPFDGTAGQHVAFFVSEGSTIGEFDYRPITFTIEGISDGVHAVQKNNNARGAVTALITATRPANPRQDSVIQTIVLRGDGGSINSAEFIANGITSTGPLGDVNVSSGFGINNIAAPSIFGSITTAGNFTGIIQTTGQRIDPITGAVSHVAATLGRAFVVTPAHGAQYVTTTVIQGGTNNTFAGEIVSRGNLISAVGGDIGISGVIAADGNIGTISNLLATPARVGGIVANGPLSGEIISLANIVGDMTFNSLRGGRIAAKGAAGKSPVAPLIGILGNLTVKTNGTIDPTSAIVTRGQIGAPTVLGTHLSVPVNYGIIAAKGAINRAAGGRDLASGHSFPAAAGTPNAAAIDAIFTNGSGKALTLDDPNTLDLQGLATLVRHMKLLKVNAKGKLVDS
jgi:hypothetical protein